jgi:MFS family permease
MIGLDLSRTSAFMAVAIISAMVLAWPMGKICDHYDRRRVMVLVSLLAAIAATVAALVGVSNSLALVLAVGVFTGLSASLYPIAVAITHDYVSHSRIMAASASLLLSFGIGSIIGPIVLAELISLTGPDGLFQGSAGFLIALALLINYQIRTTPDIPVEEQEHFINTTPQALSSMTEIDPRNEDFHTAAEKLAEHANTASTTEKTT